MDAMMRLVNLSAEVEALRNKTELNRRMAKEATMQAANATQVASSLQQVSIGSAGGRFFSLCSFADAVKSLLLFFLPSRVSMTRRSSTSSCWRRSALWGEEV